MNTQKKKDKKKSVNENEKKERENTHTDDMIAASLEPKEQDRPTGGFEIPTLEEVESTLRNITVRPPEDEIQLCAGYFVDKMEREEWKTRDWRNALRRYAARWIQRGNTASYAKQPARQQQPEEAQQEAEPTIFQLWPIELGGSIEKNEESLRRYLDEEVLDWERQHGRRVSWRQAADWKERLFAPLLKRLEKEMNNQ